MASDYENLAAAYETDTSKLIAEVDCTAESSQALCQEHGVEGFPTLKYGNPTSLFDYEGGRDFDSMYAFVNSDVKLSCSPFNLELCNDDEKKVIKDVMKMDDKALEEEIAKVDAVMKEADEDLEKGIEGLQARFEAMMSKHEAEMDKIKEEADYKLMKSVLKLKKVEAGITDDDDEEGLGGDDDWEEDDDDDEMGEEL